jgi:alpha-L-fucosidase
MVIPRIIYPNKGCNLDLKNTVIAPPYHARPDWGSREFIVQGVTEYKYPLDWWPIENIVSIRPGWFYHKSQDNEVKSLEKLLDIYYCSVGYGGPLLLNIPPDRRGRIHENDVQRLKELGAVLRATFKTDLARGVDIQAFNVRNNNPAYSAANAVDGDKNTYWMADDGVTAATLELDLGLPQAFNHVVLQEFVQRGQRIESFVIEIWNGQDWQEITGATTIGYKRILRFADTTAQKVRLRINQSRVCPTISNFGLFYAPLNDKILENISER